MSRHDHAVELLTALVCEGGTRRAGVLSTPHRVPGRDGFVPRFACPDADLDAVAARCLRIGDAGADVYAGVQLLRGVPARGRGGAADTSGLVALAGDLDVQGGAHATTTDTGLPLPPTRAEALGILAGLPDPTFTVWTGGGIHPWWVLRRHEHLDVDEARGIVRGWGDLLRDRGRARGWHVDQTGDLARVLRLPGTVNHKYSDRPVVEIIATGPRYGLDELAALIPPPPARTAAGPVVPASGGGDAAEVTARWSAETDWSVLLEPAGWRCCRDDGHGERHWTRPGKTAGTSAQSHDDPPVLWVHTTGSTLPAAEALTKLDVYAHLVHGGDVRAAWHAIAPPLDMSVPDVDRLARFVADGGPVDRLGGRLVWAARQIAYEADRDVLVVPLIRAAHARGLSLAAAARAVACGLQTPGRTPC
ncbi:hypothetical protein [Parafrankia elaeagni]|uniref:hypothetical protein n=1 Tax=Parafrankia elaeagni TaxID=222534 RepID=UPI000367299F|nr:hypothetical protein [Parafrankia elaeagni]